MGNDMLPEMSVEHPPLSTWQVQVLRLTGFPSPVAQVQPDTWWRDLTDESPETRTSQLKTGGLKRDVNQFVFLKKILLYYLPME
jgi:hypothetical protein